MKVYLVQNRGWFPNTDSCETLCVFSNKKDALNAMNTTYLDFIKDVDNGGVKDINPDCYRTTNKDDEMWVVSNDEFQYYEHWWVEEFELQ